jgi:hypothetical protein
MPGPWPVASHDGDFDPYLAGMPETSVRMFRRFVDMSRASGPAMGAIIGGDDRGEPRRLRPMVNAGRNVRCGTPWYARL